MPNAPSAMGVEHEQTRIRDDFMLHTATGKTEQLVFIWQTSRHGLGLISDRGPGAIRVRGPFYILLAVYPGYPGAVGRVPQHQLYHPSFLQQGVMSWWKQRQEVWACVRGAWQTVPDISHSVCIYKALHSSSVSSCCTQDGPEDCSFIHSNTEPVSCSSLKKQFR